MVRRKKSKPKKASKSRKRISIKTIKLLFMNSGKQCAHPECTESLLEPETSRSEAYVAAHVSHIYGYSDKGPRGKADLTEEERNWYSNLILFCRHHHGIVDGQEEDYPATLLQRWKREHEEKVNLALAALFESEAASVFSHSRFPTYIVDEKIEQESRRIRRARFFNEFKTEDSTLRLARRLSSAELSGGSDIARAHALGWCARLLARGSQKTVAKECLQTARSLATCDEVEIAAAFLDAETGEKSDALSALALIDTPVSRSAALMIATNDRPPQTAKSWLESSGYEISDLDPDGKSRFLGLLLQSGDWQESTRILPHISSSDCEDAPILYHLLALSHLVQAVPEEFREVVVSQIPFEVSSFPLASDLPDLENRRLAHEFFLKAVISSRELGCELAATIDDDYALWLQLRDPETFETGKKRLKANLRDSSSALRLAYFALHFDIKLDMTALEKLIDQQSAIHGGLTRDGASARFALAFTQGTPSAVANYIAKHRSDLSKHFHTEVLLRVEISVLLSAGLVERARDRLTQIKKGEISERAFADFQRKITESEEANPADIRKGEYRRSGSLNDLYALVEELEQCNDWEGVAIYGESLFTQTRAISDAERLSNALDRSGKTAEQLQFLDNNLDIVKQSRKLQLQRCWCLYQQGKLLEAKSNLAALPIERDDPNYRGLEVNIAVAIGDWQSLSGILALEVEARAKRSVEELVGAAQLAVYLESPAARELLMAAADRGADNPGILATCHLLAVRAGWDNEASAYQWLDKAAALSGETGPLQKISLREILTNKPDWDRHESEIWEQLACGKIPIFAAAQALNKSLIELTLTRALANLEEPDPRRRALIPAFSGRRSIVEVGESEAVSFDATALLTLSFLGILETALNAFTMVVLPHSTLGWLFEEKHKATFHQPSRIADAHQLRNMLASGLLSEHLPSTSASSDLSAQIGEDLAELIAEAENLEEGKETQKLVVRPSPVHRIGSLLEEQADLSEYTSVLVSCHSVVDKLRSLGRLTAEEQKRAHNYLRLHEKRWPCEPEVSDEAELYLDSVAVSYFLHLKILDKLHKAGFSVFINSRDIEEVNALISYETISSHVTENIEQIRRVLHSRIMDGSIEIAAQSEQYEEDGGSINRHPTYDLFALAEQCSAIISDDRFVNQHTEFRHSAGSSKTLTTLDLLQFLHTSDVISTSHLLECHTQLRQAGYAFFVPSTSEMKQCLSSSLAKSGQIVESAELRAIRENLLKSQMHNWLQLPKEEAFINAQLQVLFITLKDLWEQNLEIQELLPRSDWILRQMDPWGWMHRFGEEGVADFLEYGRARILRLLLAARPNEPENLKTEYWNWIEDRVVSLTKEIEPTVFDAVVEMYKQQVNEMVEAELAN